MELVGNAELILTKNAILQKVNQLLGNLQAKQQHYIKLHAATYCDEAFITSPKISKGEKYKGLPYLILDYPRFFKPSAILAIRTMFWWGNFFSITLHLSGSYKKKAEQKIISLAGSLQESGYYYCINHDPWEHHFETDNYTSLKKLSHDERDDAGDPGFENTIRNNSFIKLANKIPLQQWDDAEDILLAYFKQLIELLAD